MSKIADSGIEEQQRQMNEPDDATPKPMRGRCPADDTQRVFNTPEWEEAFAKVGFYDLELQYQVMGAELQQLKAKRLAAMNEAIAYVFDARRRAAHEAQGGNGLSSPEINA